MRFGKNVIIFDVGNRSSSNPENRKNNLLILGERPACNINGRVGSQKKNCSINFTKANTNFCFSLHHNTDDSYLFVNGKEIFKFQVDNKNFNFLTQFCLQNISNGFDATESREVSLNGKVYDFSVC